MALTVMPVTATFQRAPGVVSAAGSQLQWQLSADLFQAGQPVANRAPLSVALDSNARFAVLLWAVDDTGVAPTGVFWTLSGIVDGEAFAENYVLSHSTPAQTTVAAGSNGQVLPQATINVASTAGFAASGYVAVVSSSGPQLVAYTGVTTTTFTGCTGGAGTVSTGGAVVGQVDISQLTPASVANPLLPVNAVQLQGNPVSGAAPTTSYVLTWNGAAWAPAATSGGVSSFNTRTGAVTLSKTDVTGTGVAASDVSAVPAAALPSTGTTGAPTAGTWTAGQQAYDSADRIWTCTVSGTPGTWQQAGTSGQTLTDTGAWQANHSYTVDQTFSHIGLRYLVTTAYTSAASFGSTDTTNTFVMGVQGGSMAGTLPMAAPGGTGLIYVTPGPLWASDPRLGFVGDGSTDNATAMSQAASLLAATPGELAFGPGVFLISNFGDWTAMHGIKIRGVGAPTIDYNAGVATTNSTELRYTGTGSGTAWALTDMWGWLLEDFGLTYSSGSFTGTLVGIDNATHDHCWDFRSHNMNFGPSYALGVAASNANNILSLNHLVDGYFQDTNIIGGNNGISGPANFANCITFMNGSFASQKTNCILTPGSAWSFYGTHFEALTNGKPGLVQVLSNFVQNPGGILFVGCSWWDSSTGGDYIIMYGPGLTLLGCTFYAAGSGNRVVVLAANGSSGVVKRATVIGNTVWGTGTGTWITDPGSSPSKPSLTGLVAMGNEIGALTDPTSSLMSSGDVAGFMVANNGGLVVGSVSTLPTASASNRGQQMWVPGNGTTTADILYVCLESATGTFSWKQIQTG